MPRVRAGFILLSILLIVPPQALAQTPDGITPAVEEACGQYQGEGARHGLCIAYCEAQDCENTKFSNPSCAQIAERFIAYSVRQGYVKSPKEKPAIECRKKVEEGACSKADAFYCGGKDLDCIVEGNRVCQSVCSSVLRGFDEKNNPLCAVTKCVDKCVAEDPTK
jgi:hypothetical protein